MKKILSLTLAVLMVVSMIPTAFAAEAGGNWAGGTAVDATGEKTTVAADGTETHNVEYTITVPSSLAPGAEGTVTLEGYWPSNATVKVTADESVEMVHSINGNDTKDLAVTFATMEVAGTNFGSKTAEETVSVAAMPTGAMFGTWHGVFNYNVDYDDGTTTGGESGDEESTIKTFMLNGVEYQFEDGMTWGEWLESDYNVKPLYLREDGKIAPNESCAVKIDTHYVTSDEAIEERTYSFA